MKQLESDKTKDVAELAEVGPKWHFLSTILQIYENWQNFTPTFLWVENDYRHDQGVYGNLLRSASSAMSFVLSLSNCFI